ncbi:MAG: NAD(P)-dependent oxidoreductase [Candidatus Omnitrophota bacterium]
MSADTKIYHDKDADLRYLMGKKIAIIGYGNQGRAQSLNLRDSGLEILVGTLKDSSWEQAKEEGMAVFSIREAASQGDIILMLDQPIPFS